MFHLLQATIAVYTGFLSFRAIKRLQLYEERSEKAAKYSQTAADQLNTTRTTQAAGAVATLTSLLSSVFLSTSLANTTSGLTLSLVNAIGLSLAWWHISNFWTHKAKVPAVKDYNDAIDISNSLRPALFGLAGSWWVAGTFYLVGFGGS